MMTMGQTLQDLCTIYKLNLKITSQISIYFSIFTNHMNRHPSLASTRNNKQQHLNLYFQLLKIKIQEGPQIFLSRVPIHISEVCSLKHKFNRPQ